MRGLIKLIFNILLIIFIYSLLVYFSDRIAQVTKPKGSELSITAWKNSILPLIFTSIIGLFISTILYYVVLPKQIIITECYDILRFSGLWVKAILIQVGINTLLGVGVILSSANLKNPLGLMRAFPLLGVSILLSVLIFWILTLIYSPERVKYVPPLRYELREIFRSK